ncbi:MAG: RsmD family RNA methyltransferase [Bacteroidota bacterium]
MRIISGTHKSILLHAPTGLPVRPTTDRSKESLFNIIENNFDIEKLTVLDIFSGTGNIAYEFCSRGAIHVDAVDVNEKCIAFIKQTKQKLKFENLFPLKKDAFSYLKNCTQKYDIIFADAPYANKQIIEIPRLTADTNLLNKNGWLIVEHEVHLDLNSEKGFFDKRIYGQSAFSFFTNDENK